MSFIELSQEFSFFLDYTVQIRHSQRAHTHTPMNTLLSVKTHRRVATGNTKSREAAGALAGTGPSVNGPDSGTRRRFRRCRACHLTYTWSERCERACDDLT